MRRLTLIVVALLLAWPQAPSRRLARTTLEDKIRGGWAGQMIGVSYGAPTEFRSNGKIIEENLRDYQNWTPDRIKNAIKQDDLYVEMTFAEVMDRIGLEATTEQYGEMFKNSKYELWHANAAARRWLNQGLKAPLSGEPRYNLHADDIDFQIEADFIGLMTPGLPQEANKYCDRVGRVMNYGDGLYGGMFVCGMYAAAFFETDPRRVVEQGLASIPAESGYARIIRDVLAWTAAHPDDWRRTWRLIEEKWNRDDPCPDGALRPFNIDAKLNGAYIALGLLSGRGDFDRTLDVTTRSGQDSDCNPSNAAGILGVILGFKGIPDRWKLGLDQIADTKFEYTNYSFNEITQSTVARALKVIAGAGGQVSEREVVIPAQRPQSPVLERWEMGVPEKIVEARDAAWRWQGAWSEEKEGQAANGGGAAAELEFNGVAIALVGPLSPSGGSGEIYLDGRKAAEFNAYIVERTTDNDLWHIFGLKPGAHTLRVVTLDQTDARSRGKKIVISRAIIYRAR